MCVKRKRRKVACKIRAKFADLKEDFLTCIADTRRMDSILPSLIVNIDETMLPITPVSNWTQEKSSTSEIPITGIDNKRQMTVFVGCTMDGQVLPPWLLHDGSTDR